MSEVGIPAPAAAAKLLEHRPLAQLLDLLCQGVGEARIVGGALRNAMLGRFVHEVDIATTLLPDVVIERAKAAGLRSIPTGIAHGTVTVLVGGEPYEVTTLREDVETDGRHAVVRFGGDFQLDAQRRDFTVNALSMDRHGRLYDYTGGVADLEAGLIRFIGEPATRIREDYLRILRFFRFSADYAEGPLDAAGLAAAMALRDGTLSLSKERIRAELFKLLMARRAGEIVEEISAAGILGPLLTLAPDAKRLQRLIAHEPDADGMLRLAALCILVPEDADRLRESLRLSNEEHRRLTVLGRGVIKLHGCDAPPSNAVLRALLFELGRQGARDTALLAQIDAPSQMRDGWASARTFLMETAEPRVPFSGADLQKRGFTEGRALGLALRELQTRWIAAGFPQDADTLARMLDDVASAAPRA